MEYIYLRYILCFLLGCLTTLVIIFRQAHGVLVIDDTGEKTNWSFIVEKPFESFEKSKIVIFKVKQKTSSR